MKPDFAAFAPAALARWRDRLPTPPGSIGVDALGAAAALWWSDRSTRERWLLGAFAAVALIAGLDRLVWHPLAAMRAAAVDEIARDDRIAAQLRVAGPDVARIAAARTGSLSTLVTQRAASAGLTVARIEPLGANVAVTFDGVAFDPLVDWLGGLDRDAGVEAIELKVERRPDPGVVSAQVTLTER